MDKDNNIMTKPLKITKEFLEEIEDNLWADPVDYRKPFNEDEKYRLVYQDDADSRRWSFIRTYVVQFKSDGSFHQFHQDIGLTENQENGDLYYDGPVLFEAKTKTITREVFVVTPINY